MATLEEKDIAAYNFVKQMEVEYYGPKGEPIYIQKDAHKYIKRAEAAPHLFDEFGLDALLKAHHENCNGQMFNSWPEYNKLIAADKGLSVEEHKVILDKFNDDMAALNIRQSENQKKYAAQRPQRGMRPVKKSNHSSKKKK